LCEKAIKTPHGGMMNESKTHTPKNINIKIVIF
jgi:hypothetical protein